MTNRFPVWSLIIIAAIVVIMVLFWPDNLLATIILAIVSAVVFRYWHSRKDIIYFVIPAIVGPLVEAICIYYGAWSYSNPTYLIPIWLPLAWGLGGIAVFKMAPYFIGKGGLGNDN